jgi:hypothetical protein
VRLLDPRLNQNITVETDPRDPAAAKARPQLPERVGVLVDDGHRMTLILKDVAKRRADPAAPHDHDVHDQPSSSNGA